MNQKAEMLLSEAAAETQKRLRQWKAIGKRIGLLLLFAFAVVGAASFLNLYQTTSSKQFAWLMVIIAVFAAIVGGLSWVQQKFFSKSKKAKTVFLIIEILLYLGLSMVSTGVWQNAAP